MATLSDYVCLLNMTQPNYYTLLDVPQEATEDEIKRAYRKLAMQYHPDRNNNSKIAEEMFKEVQAAYSYLSDPEKRKAHDEALQPPSSQYAPRRGQYTQPPQQPRRDPPQQPKAGTNPFSNAQNSSKVQPKRGRVALLISGVIVSILLLIAGGKFYKIWAQGESRDIGLGGVFNNTPDLMSDVKQATNVIEVATVGIHDKRVDDAMRQLYGRNYVETQGVTCWLTPNASSSGTPSCMLPLSATLVKIGDEELLYLQAIEKGSQTSARVNTFSDTEPTWGAAVYDVKREIVRSSAPFVTLPKLKGAVQPMKLVQISCGGVFAWQSVQSDRYLRIFAPQNKRVVNVTGDASSVMHQRGYRYSFEPPVEQESCAYDLQVTGGARSPRGEPYSMRYSLDRWSYKRQEVI